MHIKRIVAVYILVLLVAPNLAGAQAPEFPSNEEVQRMMGNMESHMNAAYAGMVRVTAATLAEPATAEQLATFAKNYYDALVRKGFSKEEAMRIIAGVGIPIASAGR